MYSDKSTNSKTNKQLGLNSLAIKNSTLINTLTATL